MEKRLTILVNYLESEMTSYEIYDWAEKTFGDREIKTETEELRRSDGKLLQIKFVVVA